MKPQLIIPYAALAFAVFAAGLAIYESRDTEQEALPMWTLVEKSDGIAIQVPTDDPRHKKAYAIHISDLYQMSHEDMRRILQAVVNEHNKSILNP